MSEHDSKELAAMIAAAGEGGTLILTGAGVSTASGIPDFRSPGTGLWTQVDPMKAAHIDVWRFDPRRFWAFYRHRLDIPDKFDPNPAHEAIAALERHGFARGLVTQNIDGLHQKAGSEQVIEFHGSVRRLVCPCGWEVSREEGLALFREDGVPYCEQCHEPLKPDVTLFGEMLPEGAFEDAVGLLADTSLVLCAGSSLVVRPFADLPLRAVERGQRLAILNRGWTPLDPLAGLKLEGDVAELLPAAVEELLA